jgi:hypothetical protein
MRRCLNLSPRHALLAGCALALLPGLAVADNFPPMRSGLWMSSMVMHMNMAGQPPDTDNTPMVRYNCIDGTTFAATMKMMSGMMKGCVTSMTGSGGVYTLTIHCTNPDGLTGSLDGTTTITASGDTALHMVGTTVSALSGMKSTSDSNGDVKWLEDCPAGIVPGDYGTMQNGVFTKQGSILSAP